MKTKFVKAKDVDPSNLSAEHALRIGITKAVIGVRCTKCGLPGLLDQKPGHKCSACFGLLAEHKVDNTNCSWCTDETICVVCAREAFRLP